MRLERKEYQVGFYQMMLQPTATNTDIQELTKKLLQHEQEYHKMHHQCAMFLLGVTPPTESMKNFLLRYPQRNHLAGRVEIGAF